MKLVTGAKAATASCTLREILRRLDFQIAKSDNTGSYIFEFDLETISNDDWERLGFHVKEDSVEKLNCELDAVEICIFQKQQFKRNSKHLLQRVKSMRNDIHERKI